MAFSVANPQHSHLKNVTDESGDSLLRKPLLGLGSQTSTYPPPGRRQLGGEMRVGRVELSLGSGTGCTSI